MNAGLSRAGSERRRCGAALLLVPAEMVQPTDLSAEALMSIYVSMGVTAKQFLKPGGGDATETA